MTNCKICKSKAKRFFEAHILSKYLIAYYYCDTCGFLQTQEPFWLAEAYRESSAASDTGGLLRSLTLAETISVLYYFFFNRNALYLDFGGGYGLFTRRMRDIGFDVYWQDCYTPNLFARGFEYDEARGQVEAITSFETFEHFVDPMAEIEKMLSYSKNIIFTTDLLPHPVPKPEMWSYYGFHHGQHISFYSAKTLQFIAEKFGRNIYYVHPLHILTTKTIRPAQLKLLLKLRQFGLFMYVKRRMTGKAVTDSEKLARQSLL